MTECFLSRQETVQLSLQQRCVCVCVQLSFGSASQRTRSSVCCTHEQTHLPPSSSLLFLLSHPSFLTPSVVLPAWNVLLVDNLNVSRVHLSIICDSNGNHGNQENNNLNLYPRGTHYNLFFHLSEPWLCSHLLSCLFLECVCVYTCVCVCMCVHVCCPQALGVPVCQNTAGEAVCPTGASEQPTHTHSSASVCVCVLLLPKQTPHLLSCVCCDHPNRKRCLNLLLWIYI